MSQDSPPLTNWIGRRETITDRITLAPVEAVAAMLDDTTSRFAEGDALPPLWHQFFFLPKAPRSWLDADGHPQRGPFMPPIALPRRMFASARLRFAAPLVIGETASREGKIQRVETKEGKSGSLAFITVGYRIRQGECVCVEEEQDIVYRGVATSATPSPIAAEFASPPGCTWCETITPDPVLLFRFSALTFNGHRIHYDRDYARRVERYPGLVVHGPLTALLLIDMVRRRATRPVVSYSFRAEAPLFDGDALRLIGSPDDDQIGLQAQRVDGKTAMTATAQLG